MWISSHKIIRNVSPPNWVIDKLKDHFINLKDELVEQYKDEYHFRLEFSMHSEAAYLFVRNLQHENEYKISFRNHENYRNHFYDEEILLHQFHTWSKCEKYFYKNRLPKVIEKLQEMEQQSEKEELEIEK